MRLNQNLLTRIGTYAHLKIVLILPEDRLEITPLPMRRYTIFFKKNSNQIDRIEPYW